MMKKSISYHITLFVIKLKGLKKIFSGNPINYEQLRKEDVHTPRSTFFKRKEYISTFTADKTTITAIKSRSGSDRLLIFIHGGAMVSGPAQHHWDSIERIAKDTDYNIWFCNYPKAPENKIQEIAANIDQLYRLAIQQYPVQNIILMGDSAGATLIITLVQRLIIQQQPIPSRILLICPVVDPSFENPAIATIDRTDPMLSRDGVLSAKKMSVDNGNLKDPLLSPLAGSFHQFPETILFIADNDITYPDQLLMIEQLKQYKVLHQVVTGKEMPHIWPLLPFMQEAKTALKRIINILNN